jgi:hypothetical protein
VRRVRAELRDFGAGLLIGVAIVGWSLLGLLVTVVAVLALVVVRLGEELVWTVLGLRAVLRRGPPPSP